MILASIRHKIWFFCLAVSLLLLDQLTKNLAVDILKVQYQVKEFLPYFNFTLLYNKGAAFSFLSDAGGWQRWFFGITAFVVSIILVIWILRLDRNKTLELLGLSCILGGAIGNLWDRIILSYVVDFIDWYYPAESCLPFFYYRADLGSCHWPAFNIADASIFVGVVLLLIDMFNVKKRGSES